MPPPAPPIHADPTGARQPWVTTSGGRSSTSSGHPVVLRGIDVPVGQSDLAPIAAQLGANFVRIYVGWNAIEPQPP